MKKFAADNGFRGIKVSQYGVDGPDVVAREFVRALNEGTLRPDLPLCVVQ